MIIYPITSGQEWIEEVTEVINVKKDILAILEEYKESNQDDRIEKVKEYITQMKEENPDYAEFLKNETAQEVAVLFYIRWNYQFIVSNGDVKYDGTIIEEQIGGSYYKVDVTISGLIAAEHLIGTGDLHKALLGELTWEKADDENGTNALSYMRDMGGLDMERVLGEIK